jgi:hypoxanthine phosphoribosyltransferase
MGVEKIYISWEEVNRLLDIINEQVESLEDFDKPWYVSGIPRGGTVLAVLYSHRFDIPYLNNPQSRDHNLLILDDIADSGKTLQEWRDRMNSPIFATLHYKEISSAVPDFYGAKLKKDCGWIVYPWEREDSKTIQDYLDN